MPFVSYASVIADDIVALSAFYSAVLGFPFVEDATDIYRGLDAGRGLVLAFSAPAVYDLLGMTSYRPVSGTRQYLTFELDSDDEVDERSELALLNGATVLHGAYETSYGAYQVVLADPEGNVFRLNHARPSVPST